LKEVKWNKRPGKRSVQLLDDGKGNRRYWNLKEEALDRIFLEKLLFGSGYGSAEEYGIM